ncbi:hypothetical protein EV196_102237 [Mariniflexile fucanivorans]|uniref:Deoxyribose-phosphate aldolase n=1 Tax=Mariniflexile fucanivorans TaxID=264023 RepID=A0A4V2QED7_9FLAO|nr:DUF6503 family protein [Mariniflexile fucanivorans]TCL67677.1 hypothetical protein EV196_102237 [Mariniflexile fucanivorans]
MPKKIILLVVLTISMLSCEKEIKDATVIVRKSIEVSGGNLIKNSNIEFDFRDKHYFAKRNSNGFTLARVSDSIVDLLSNKGFERVINEHVVEVADSMIPKYAASVNSVHYFSVLPYGLDGDAVNKSYLGTSKLAGKEYYKIKITFNEEGGGEDFEDVFIYWINAETFKVDYLAYSYNEDDGVGFRFREAYNERYIKGIRFVDYNNYKPTNENVSLENLDNLFETGDLSLLSKIELKNIIVD